MNSRRTTLLIALVVAAAVGYLTVHYLTSVAPPAPAVVESASVVIATQDIHAREKITPQMMQTVKRPLTDVEPQALSDPKAAEGGYVALIQIPEGAQLTEAKIAKQETVGVTGQLKTGMRAVSIPMDYIKSVSGLVNPGDKVDVMASYTRGSNKNPPTRTIIRDALVLAVNSTLEPTDSASAAPGSGPNAPAAVTLEVTAKQADLLTYADNNTTLRLALVGSNESPRAEAVEPLEIPDVEERPPAQPVAAPPAPTAAPAPPAAVAPAPKASQILVIEGDHITDGGSH